MTEAAKQREKTCPVCAKEYAEEDNYCGLDGALLELDPARKDKYVSGSAGTALTADDMKPARDGGLQH